LIFYFTTKAQGNRLGLATSYSIVKRHNGHIRVEFESGQGTTVSVYLPAIPGMALTVKKAIEPFLSGHGKILVMDDQTSIREVIGGMLTQLACEPVCSRWRGSHPSLQGVLRNTVMDSM